MQDGFSTWVASGRQNIQDSYGYIMGALYGDGEGGRGRDEDAMSVAERTDADGVDIAEEHPVVGVTEEGYLAALYALWAKDPEAAEEEAAVVGTEEVVGGQSVGAWLAAWQADPERAKVDRKAARAKRREERRVREVGGMAAEDRDAGTRYETRQKKMAANPFSVAASTHPTSGGRITAKLS